MSVRAISLGILGWGFLAIFPAWLLLFIFDPMDARHFLLDAEYAETVIPIARLFGTVGSISLVILCIFGFRKNQLEAALSHNGEEYRRRSARWKMLRGSIAILFSIFIAYTIFHDSAKTVIALVMHHLVERHEFSAPFTIKHVVRQKLCKGVQASNLEFYDDKICGVTWKGKWSLYDGRDVILSGKRSEYGFMVERYQLSDSDATARSSASAQPPVRLP